MIAALFALGASLSWGSSSFIAGLESRRRSVWTVTAVSQIASVLSAAVLLLFAANESLSVGHLAWAIVAGVTGATGVVAFYRALKIGAMSVVAPIVAAQVVIPVAVGLVVGERPAAAAYVGMVLAVGGVALIGHAGGRGDARTPRAAILLAVLTAVLFGIMNVGLDMAGSGGVLLSVFVVRAASACVILGFFVATRKTFDATARDLPALAAVGILLTVANVLLTQALTIGLLSVVAVLCSLSPAVTTGLAQVFLHERLTRLQWAAVAAVFAGVVLLSI